MFLHAFLEGVLAAQHVLEDGHLVPEPAAIRHDLQNPVGADNCVRPGQAA
ncbi:hypothetical protein JOF56_009717 [Kibdelosporangium banguiense]|uniref:Uncharacterized protein n=1 Tax=Kibdelosporangium banguiense TaxID=1365924 RepID=A0ABS4TY82_9PSEU|nr:hypothetical protein [Kibdelosporangium banguiense]